MSLKGKKVFITGADGFIGSHLAEELVKQGATVKSLVYYNSWNIYGWLEDVDKNIRKEMEIVLGDVRDSELMLRETSGIDVIFHLSAVISIPYSYKASRSFIETNVIGTLNMIHAGLSNRVERFIHNSTSEVYGTALYVPIDEKHPFQPQSPYSASKIGGDMLALSYYHAFDLSVVVIRPFNTYGPRQTPRAVIPTIILQCLKNKESGNPIKLGSLTPRRDLTFVQDTVGAFIRIAESTGIEGKTFNIATGESVSIQELTCIIMNIIGVNLEIEQQTERIRPTKSEVMLLTGDAHSLRRMCNWQPEYPLEQGLAKTIEWFSTRVHQYDTERYWL